MIFEYLDIDNNRKEIYLPFEKSKFLEIKKKVKGADLDDLGYWEFWDLRDFLFNELIIKGFKKKIISFFNTIHNYQYLSDNQPKSIEIDLVDVYYHFYYGESIYLFSEPSLVFYKDGTVDRVETHLNYNTDFLEHLLEKILIEFEVDFKPFKEYEDLSDNELELGRMFTKLVFECWLKVKKDSNSKVYGMLSYATGGAGCIDLDNGNEIDESESYIKEYFKKRGMKLN